MFKLITFSLLIIVLTGCATLPAEAPAPTETPAPTASPAPSATPAVTATTPPKSELPGEAVIVYKRNGGIAGLDEMWTIYPDGNVTFAAHAQGEGPERLYQVEAAEVAALVDTLETLGFFALTGNYLPLNTCCDRITYDIEARSDDQYNHVATLDGAEGTPPELWQAIDALNKFVGQF
jgi:hypothetical protein